MCGYAICSEFTIDAVFRKLARLPRIHEVEFIPDV
jgi:hypothetical protein